MSLSRDQVPAVIAWYFGCVDQPGHYFWAGSEQRPGTLRRAYYDDVKAVLPWDRIDGKLTPEDRRRQGDALFHDRYEDGGWVAFALHDFTVDSRPNSNSVFFFKGALTAEEAVQTARHFFPQIMDRIGSVNLPGEAA